MNQPRRAFRAQGPPKARAVPHPPPKASRGTDAHGLDRAVVLVGPMAAGKTSLGKRLAKALDIPFVDSDAKIVQRYGPIAKIFEEQGEPAFREIEASVIAAELALPGPKILALGGGAVLTEATRERLRNYPVILLMTTERAVKRTANLAKRPLLKDDPGAWSRILDERRALYEEVADTTFRTDRLSHERLTDRSADWVRNWAHEQAPHRPADGQKE